MKLSASQAAKETGKSIPTITRAIKSGKISAQQQANGGYLIDASELLRVFPRLPFISNVTHTVTDKMTEVLEVKLAGMEREIALLLSERDDLRRRLDGDAEERRKLTMLISDMRLKATEKPTERKRWFSGRHSPKK